MAKKLKDASGELEGLAKSHKELEEFFTKSEDAETGAEAASEQEGETEEASSADDGEVEKGEGEEETSDCEETVKAFPCPHCSGDIGVEDVAKAVAEMKKASQKGGKNIPARTAAAEEQQGFSSGQKNRNGKPRSGTQGPTRGGGSPPKQNPGDVGSYKGKKGAAKGVGSMSKSNFYGQSPLMTLVKSDGLGSDDEIAREIARQHGIDPDKLL